MLSFWIATRYHDCQPRVHYLNIRDCAIIIRRGGGGGGSKTRGGEGAQCKLTALGKGGNM